MITGRFNRRSLFGLTAAALAARAAAPEKPSFHLAPGTTRNTGPLDSFSAAVTFNPSSIGPTYTLLAQTGRCILRLLPNGALNLSVHYAPNFTQGFDFTQILEPDSWYQLAISLDRSARRLSFVFRQPGDPTSQTSGAFKLLPASDLANTQSLQIGDATATLYDRVLNEAELIALLDATLPARPAAAPPTLHSHVLPMERDPAVHLPRRSDVPLSSRWWHPAKPNDPHDTLRDLKAFGATRLEWIFDTKPAHIRQIAEAGCTFIPTINASDNTPGRPYSCKTFDGTLASFSWMNSWTQADGQPTGACCVNNEVFRAMLAKTIEQVIKDGASGVQFDDWSSNLSLSSGVGDCFCDYCLKKFTAAPGGNYREFLRTQRGVRNTSEYKTYRRTHASDPLQQAWQQFQATSVRENMQFVKKTLADHPLPGGRRATLSINANLGQVGRSRVAAGADLADYIVGEGADQTLAGMFINARSAEAVHRPTIFSPFPYKMQRTRSHIALQYAMGQLCLVPYDIWMRASELPRYFGKPSEYGDLFAFVRANPALFDDAETVATVGIAFDPATADEAVFRPLVQSLAEANIPFVLLPIDRAPWPGRLRNVIDLAKQRYPNARVWPPQLTPEFLRAVSVVAVEPPNVVATLRAKPGGFAALHLVNTNFDEFSHAVPLANFGVRLRQREFWGTPRSVELLAPNAPTRTLAVEAFGREQRIVVPELKTWAVLRFRFSD